MKYKIAFSIGVISCSGTSSDPSCRPSSTGTHWSTRRSCRSTCHRHPRTRRIYRTHLIATVSGAALLIIKGHNKLRESIPPQALLYHVRRNGVGHRVAPRESPRSGTRSIVELHTHSLLDSFLRMRRPPRLPMTSNWKSDMNRRSPRRRLGGAWPHITRQPRLPLS